jgi:lysophospholipase L1-like esterase
LDEAERDRLWDDGLHLTGEGYKMMGDVIAVRLFEILQEQTNAKKRASTTSD